MSVKAAQVSGTTLLTHRLIIARRSMQEFNTLRMIPQQGNKQQLQWSLSNFSHLSRCGAILTSPPHPRILQVPDWLRSLENQLRRRRWQPPLQTSGGRKGLTWLPPPHLLFIILTIMICNKTSLQPREEGGTSCYPPSPQVGSTTPASQLHVCRAPEQTAELVRAQWFGVVGTNINMTAQ